MTEPTPHFGLDRIGAAGEDISKNGFKILGADRETIDNILYALFTRSFNGDPALGDPTDPPDLVLLAAGGALPAGTTLYYRVSFIDQYGLESAASDEASVTTPDVIAAPTAPALSASATGGTLVPGAYNYIITEYDSHGGETTVSALATLQLGAGAGTAIDLDFPAIDSEAAGFRVYRSRPGQTSLYFVAQLPTTDPDFAWTDNGYDEDQSRLAPSINTTNATNSVQVTIPGAFIPEQAMAWRIYRTLISGDYGTAALVHEVVEPATTTSPIPTTVYTDLGGDLLVGVPREVSSTAPQGPQLNLQDFLGTLPLAAVPRGVRCLSTYGAGALVDGTVLNVTESPAAVRPVRISAFFQTPPTDTVRIRFTDGTSTVELQCSSSTHRGGDAAGFWRKEFPLLLDAVYEAEDGVRSADTVLIDPDVAALNGQAVALQNSGEYVEVDLGALDPGDYATFAKLRVLNFDTAAPAVNDLVVSVIRTDTSAVVASSSFSLHSTTPLDPPATPADFVYQELTGPTFTAVGGVDLKLRVAKATTCVNSYDVDFVRYTASVPSLAAGPITVTAVVDGGGTSDGADVNVSLWF